MGIYIYMEDNNNMTISMVYGRAIGRDNIVFVASSYILVNSEGEGLV